MYMYACAYVCVCTRAGVHYNLSYDMHDGLAKPFFYFKYKTEKLKKQQ